jgi:hypothetical protein
LSIDLFNLVLVGGGIVRFGKKHDCFNIFLGLLHAIVLVLDVAVVIVAVQWLTKRDSRNN